MAVYLGQNKVSTYFKETTIQLSDVTIGTLNVSPTNATQVFNTPANNIDLYNKVIVNGDSNLIPSNIRAGVSIFGVAGSYSPASDLTLRSITVNPSTSTQTITPPSGYNGFNSITVNPITAAIDSDIIPENIKSGVTILGVTGNLNSGGTNVSGTLNITVNGTYDVSSYANVYVNIANSGQIPSGYLLPSGQLNITSNDTYDVSQYASVKVNVPVPSGYIVEPTDSQTFSTNGTYNVKNLAQAVINVPIPSGYIVPSGTYPTITTNGNNIDVTEYKYVNVNVAAQKPEQTRTVNPTRIQQTVYPSNGYTLSSVTVNAIPSEYVIPSGNQYITTNGTYNVNNKQTVTVEIENEIHNFIYSTTEPANATEGTVWFKPVD